MTTPQSNRDSSSSPEETNHCSSPTRLFSVVIPCYNYSHTLKRSVDSVLNQSFEDYELLIINDGSSDNTEAVISDLKNSYPNAFQAITQSNRGLAATRNRGISETSGQYLIFLDADDELAENALKSLCQTIQSNPEVRMVVGAHISIEPDGKERFRPRPVLPEDSASLFKMYLLQDELPIANGATAMHREIFRHYQYPVHFRCVEDIPMFAYVLANYSCLSLNQPIAKIHKHDDSMRNDVSLDLSVGLELVNEVFCSKRLSSEFMALRETYETRRLLSIFRSLFVAGDYKHALEYYWRAAKQSPAAAFELSYLRKAMKALLFSLRK
ncbi:glycosyltransferase family 2 protein [Endozoicomonas arenosclerae]|uniref:glycosyltransferase family 2 protein n=1 Tax=Endozoicomonas arenosclerae TaxID=1633495 RepID=UPI000783D758|nr:glycosyltransferase family 2 protein [Endozoicomonas arenosclerae]